jgi:hypothetical protein
MARLLAADWRWYPRPPWYPVLSDASLPKKRLSIPVKPAILVIIKYGDNLY